MAESEARILRVWYPARPRTVWKEIQETPHMFLVRSPLTLGHSELCVPCAVFDEKAALFERAAKYIAKALRPFVVAFEAAQLHEDERFKSLAEETHTYGGYLKTLILRVSAHETKEQYKVHLVPFFESHLSECTKRFRSLDPVGPAATGGLLGWLGERETELDTRETDSSLQRTLDNCANNDLNMVALAKELAARWPSEGLRR